MRNRPQKKQKIAWIIMIMLALSLSTAIVLYALKDKIVFFYTPSQLTSEQIKGDRTIRLGGLVAKGSLEKGKEEQNYFAITDQTKTVKIRYKGILPDLFREEQGVVAEGRFNQEGIFIAQTILAKHDENYMPKEVMDSLKEQGVWKEGQVLKQSDEEKKPHKDNRISDESRTIKYDR